VLQTERECNGYFRKKAKAPYSDAKLPGSKAFARIRKNADDSNRWERNIL
jgi:hypothetical protein